MSIRLEVRGDYRQAQTLFKELGPGVVRATVRALNKTATPVRAAASKLIKKERALPARTIKESLKVDKAQFGSKSGRNRQLFVTIEATGKPIPIRHFGANLTKRGVTVRIKQGGKRTLLKRGGIASFTNVSSKLGPNVFVRKGKSRLPIIKWPPVPGIPRVFASERVTVAIHKVASTVWPKRFGEEINFELRKAEDKASRAASG